MRRRWLTTLLVSSSVWSAPRLYRHSSARRLLAMTKAAPSVTVVIPARYGSSRFPGKPLVMLGRKPMIQHVYERAAACRVVTEVLVATDDDRIKQAVEGFNGRAVMIAGDYRTGTDRVAGVARLFGGDYFVNLQGDEIPLQPDLLEDLIDTFIKSG